MPPCARNSTRGPRREGWPALHAELARVDPLTAARLAAHRRAAHPARARSAPAERAAAVGAAGPARSAGRRSAPAIAVALVPADRARAARGRSRGASTRCSTRVSSTNCAPCGNVSRSIRRCRRCAASAIGRHGNTWTAPSTLAQLRATGIAATRQLAKRQLTWLRATPATVFDAAAGACRRRGGSRRGTLRQNDGLSAAQPLAGLPVETAVLLCNNHTSPERISAMAATPRHDGTHALRQAVGQPRHPRRSGRHGAALHRPPPGPRGDEPAGVRGPEAGRPQAVADAIGRRHRRPQHADQGLGPRHPGSDVAHAGRNARREHRGARRQGLFPVPRPPPGHRPRDRAGAGRDACRA